MNVTGRPRWVDKERLKRHVQMALWALATVFMAIGGVVFVADKEDWPWWKKALAGVLGAVVLAALVGAGVWLVYTWGRRPW